MKLLNAGTFLFVSRSTLSKNSFRNAITVTHFYPDHAQAQYCFRPYELDPDCLHLVYQQTTQADKELMCCMLFRGPKFAAKET